MATNENLPLEAALGPGYPAVPWKAEHQGNPHRALKMHIPYCPLYLTIRTD